MRPAYSVILFTTLSGAGFGLLAVMGAILAAAAMPAWPFAAMTLGLALAAGGLLSSTFHLGRPERAWRAFSQWRTSWLSREGVSAVAVFALASSLVLLVWWAGSPGPLVRILAAATALLSGLTIVCTAQIYASLPPVRQWRHATVLPIYLLLALASGTLLLIMLQAAADMADARLHWLALLAMIGAWVAKEVYWRAADRPEPPLSAAMATGLTRYREVRLFEAPHTESNYLLHEMGYRVARRHAVKLRWASRILGFAVPIAATTLQLLAGQPWIVQLGLALLAVTSAMIGILIERWLFFAEARHTVMLYYGAAAA